MKHCKAGAVAMAMACLVLAACGQPQDGSSQSAAGSTAASSSAGQPEKSGQQAVSSSQTSQEVGDVSIPFASEIIRFSRDYESDFPETVLIQTTQELKAYMAEQATALRLEDEFGSVELKTQLQSYDDDFFADKALLLTYLEEGSGSVGHELQQLMLQNGELRLVVQRNPLPSGMMGTTDMAWWAFCVEFDAAYAKDASGLSVVVADA